MSRSHPRPPVGVGVFAVEPDRAQLSWRAMGPGPVTLRAGDARTEVVTDGGPGTATVTGLVPDTLVRLEVRGPDAGIPPGGLRRRFRTPPHPPGAELCRFASISDLHLGEYRFGYFGTMRDLPGHDEAYPIRAARSALAAVHEWGAELLAVKGDVTTESRIDQWELFTDLVATLEVPVAIIPGNHDNRPLASRRKTPLEHAIWLAKGGPIIRLLGPRKTGVPIDPRDALDRIGHPLDGDVRTVDLPGVRLVLADTTLPHRHLGGLDHLVAPVADLATEAARERRAVWVGGHHYPMPHAVPHFWPPGVPAAEADRFFAALRAANPRAFYSAGHTHRNRRYLRHGITCTEVGSPKDFPGTWAGYVVHEGGMRQVSYRVSGADILPWLDHSRWAALGLWGIWSPGRLTDRSFTLTW